MGGIIVGYPGCPFHWGIKGVYICIHPQLHWNMSVDGLGEQVFSPLESKMNLWTWELNVHEEAVAENSRWEIQKQAERNIVKYKPGLCFALGLLVIFCFQPCPQKLDLWSC